MLLARGGGGFRRHRTVGEEAGPEGQRHGTLWRDGLEVKVK